MIDARAIIDPTAQIADGVTVGPYSIIGQNVTIDSGTWVGPHAVINGPTRIGRDNKIYQFASVGEVPQDLKFHGESSELIIGDRNTIREYVTLHRGTEAGINKTVIGSNNLLMAYVHVAHDCVVGDHVIFSNGASLAGHVEVEDHAILSGFTLVHQFCRIGEHAFTGMGSAINRDVPPYILASGSYARAIGINKTGLKRRGFSTEQINALHKAFKLLVKSHNLKQGLEDVAELAAQFPEVARFADFIKRSSEDERAIVR